MESSKKLNVVKLPKKVKKSKSKVSIVVSNQQLGESCDIALLTLEKENKRLIKSKRPKNEILFVRSGKLTVIREDESDIPRLQFISEPILREKLYRLINFYGKKGGDIRDISPPLDVVKDLIKTSSTTFRSGGRYYEVKGQAVEIYDSILAIEAKKGKSSLWPEERFRHDFQPGGRIYGLPDGSLLVKSRKKLWKNFNYAVR